MEGMDELLTRTYTEEQAEQDKKVQEELLLPKGWYRSLPPLTLTTRLSERTNVPDGKGGTRGRLEFRYFGQIQSELPLAASPETTPDIVKGGLGFTISPDLVRTDKGRPDGASTKWTQAVNAYKQATGKADGGFTFQDVAEYVRDYPVRFNVDRMPGNERFPDPSNFVRVIGAVRD